LILYYFNWIEIVKVENQLLELFLKITIIRNFSKNIKIIF